MKPILEVENIGKKYRINHENREPYLSLRDSIKNVFQVGRSSKEDFWALNDVSFSVESGESLGIVGKNGAGKSTLLKILSKITPPTTGKIVSRGRIASLLEVGTGFHPELTGRENIYLNGSILGMKRQEIYANFDAIVEFSGVEKFIDTPLKHFSSGMQLRLAFAVAAFLENEILIIDEVLAVGDAEFQKKCLGKMKDINSSGNRTVLFVSHNLNAVQSFCKSGLLLENGNMISHGNIKEITDLYLERSQSEQEAGNRTGGYTKNDRVSIQKVSMFSKAEEEPNINRTFYRSDRIVVRFDIQVLERGNYNLSVHFRSLLNLMICNPYTPVHTLEPGNYSFDLEFPENFLNDEGYKLDLLIVDNASIPIETVRDIITFDVVDDSERIWFGKFDGVIRPDTILFNKTNHDIRN